MAVSHALTVISFLEHARPPTKGARCVLIVQVGETQLHRQLTAYNVPNTVLLVSHIYACTSGMRRYTGHNICLSRSTIWHPLLLFILECSSLTTAFMESDTYYSIHIPHTSYNSIHILRTSYNVLWFILRDNIFYYIILSIYYSL